MKQGFNLGLFPRRQGGNHIIAGVTANLGSTKGRGSSTRKFNWCYERTNNYTDCISEFINVVVVPFTAPIITNIIAGNTQLTVNFTAPTSNGGYIINNYQYSTDNGTSFTSAGTTTSPIIITGLTNGTTYQVLIRAINNAINFSPNSNVVAATPVTIPSEPINVIASLGAQSLTANISWTIPVSDGGSPITSYTIISNPDSITTTTSNTNVVITSLTNGTPYTFSVYATNLVGNSLPTISNSITPIALPTASVWFDPSDPSKVTLFSGGVNSLTDLTVNGYNGQYNSPFVSATYIRPTYNVSPINGLATFRIDNSTSDVQMISVPGYNFNDQFISYAIVIRYISGTSGIMATDTPGLYGRGFGCDVTPSAGTLQTISYNAFTTWDGTPSPNIQIPVNTPSILIASISAGNWIFSLNGTQYTLALTQAKTPDNSNGLNIGCWNPSNSASIVFDCGEILAYTSFLSSTQIEAVEGYLATKWGLTSSLPPSHPYYSP